MRSKGLMVRRYEIRYYDTEENMHFVVYIDYWGYGSLIQLNFEMRVGQLQARFCSHTMFVSEVSAPRGCIVTCHVSQVFFISYPSKLLTSTRSLETFDLFNTAS